MSPEEARTKLIRAALRCVQADMADEHAHADAECQYADEQLALAARDLARAMEGLPPHQQPVGWTDKPTFPIHARYAYPDAGWEGDQKAAAGHLTLGAVYTVQSLTVGQSTSYLTFREVAGKFNTVLFAPAPEGAAP